MDFRYLAETKNEFNNFLCGILVPHIYHGIKGMLKYADNVYNQIEIKNKKGAKIDNPGVINIFKKTLDGLSSLNNHEIEEEYLRIKNNSGCIEWFDNLIKASFKSYVLFLTWDPKISNSKYSENSIYDNIIIKDFIHKCYVISCNYFRENPEIFINKNNKKEIFEILKTCIDMAIKKSLPYNDIIKEYLEIEFDKTNDINTKEISNIKNMVYNFINENKYGTIPKINNLIIEDSGKDEFINLEDPEYKRIELENFINQEKINQQNKILNKDNNKSEESTTSNKSKKSFKSSKTYDIDKKIINSSSSTSITSETNISEKHTSEKHTSNKITSNKMTSDNNTSEINISKQSEIDKKSEIDSSNIKSSINENIMSKSNDTSTKLLSRIDIKNKEIDEIINNNINLKDNEKSELSENIKYSDNKSINNNDLSSTSENIKSSIVDILTTPPPIKKKQNDRVNEIFLQEDEKKKNVKVIMGNNNILSENFDQVESFYDTMIKI